MDYKFLSGVKIFVLLTVYAIVSSSFCTFNFRSQVLPLSAEMSNSQQDVKKRDGYDHWTKEESRALLDIMVDATSRGWRNNGGIFSKKIVKDRILPLLNSKLECNKNYKNYQSRLKWFRKRWSSYSTLLEFNSGFGYDATTKRFTAENELWDNYLKDHPKNGNLRNEEFDDYEDLKIVIGNGFGARKYSTRRRVADTNTLKAGEGRDLVDLNANADNEGFVGPEHNDPPAMRSLEVLELPKNQLLSKRSRNEYDESSDLGEDALKSGILEQLTKLTKTFEGFYDLMQKREDERTYTTWDAIKEVSNLDANMRINAFNLLDTQTKKDGFLRMSPEEREEWITVMIHK